MTGDAANNAAAANAMMLFVLFMFCFCLVLFLDLAAADHVLSAVRIGNGCRCLHPIFVEHWAVSDVVTRLSGRQFLCLGAEFLERDTRVLYGTAFGQLSAFGAEIAGRLF